MRCPSVLDSADTTLMSDGIFLVSYWLSSFAKLREKFGVTCKAESVNVQRRYYSRFVSLAEDHTGKLGNTCSGRHVEFHEALAQRVVRHNWVIMTRNEFPSFRRGRVVADSTENIAGCHIKELPTGVSCRDSITRD